MSDQDVAAFIGGLFVSGLTEIISKFTKTVTFPYWTKPLIALVLASATAWAQSIAVFSGSGPIVTGANATVVWVLATIIHQLTLREGA